MSIFSNQTHLKLLLALALLTACQPNSKKTSVPNVQPLPSAQASLITLPDVTHSATPVQAMPSATAPSVSVSPIGSQDSGAVIVTFEIAPSRYFLSASGEQVRLTLIIKDPQDQTLDASQRQIEWTNTSPNAFRMIEPGVFQAISGTGFATIIAKDIQSGLVASAVLTIQRGSSEGSSGGGSSNPSIRRCLQEGDCAIRAFLGPSNPDQTPLVTAELNDPHGLAFDNNRNVLIADSLNHQIQKVDSAFNFYDYAGLGLAGFNGESGFAGILRLDYPHSITVNQQGVIYFSDKVNNRIRKIDPVTRQLNTIAGGGTGGDGQLATQASLNFPLGVVCDSLGNVYVSDSLSNKIRKIDVQTGLISTLAGTGEFGSDGDGGLATQAHLNFPHGLAMDSQDRLYIADALNHKIRRVDLSTGLITTVAGKGTVGYSGDQKNALQAELNGPRGVAVNSSGDIFIADSYNKVIRMVSERNQDITTIAGAGIGTTGQALAQGFELPYDLAIAPNGNLFVIDSLANQIFEILP